MSHIVNFVLPHDDVITKIKNLTISKTSQDFPTKILIEHFEYFVCYFHENINYCLNRPVLFPVDLKLTDVTHVYKRKSISSKNNYRPVTILYNISKAYYTA